MRWTLWKWWWIFVGVMMFGIYPASMIAQTSPFTVIPFQGVLTTSGGVVVPDGNYQLTFRLYPTASGGSAIWNETQTVSVSNGSFSVLLGSQNSFGNLQFDRRYYLGISIGGGSELEPRIPIGAVAYSIRSRWVEEVTSGNIGGVIVAGEGIGIDQSSTAVTIRALVGEAIWNAGQLRGRLVSGAAPQAGQVLKWDGTKWAPGDGGGSGGAVGGDLSGVVTNATVIALRGRPISNAAPHTGQVLRWSGSQWQPATVTNSGVFWSLGGNTLNGTEFIGSLNAQPVRVKVYNQTVFRWNPDSSLQRDDGGNARGRGAVDLQAYRSANDQVAAGAYSVISGGKNNKVAAGADFGVVSGGLGNAVLATAATIGGGANNAAGAIYSVVGGGEANVIESIAHYGTIGGGYSNTIAGKYSIIGGGRGNQIDTAHYAAIVGGRANHIGNGGSYSNGDSYGFIGGGYQNEIQANTRGDVIVGGRQNVIESTADYSFIGGGKKNRISADYSAIAGGYNNAVTASYGFIGGGERDTVSGSYSTVIGGYKNVVTGSYGAIAGGYRNSVSGSTGFVGGGRFNRVTGDYSAIVGGDSNLVSGDYSVIVGGKNNSASGDYVLIFGRNVQPTTNASYRVYFFDSTNYGYLVINRLDGNYPIHVGTDNQNGNGAHLTGAGAWVNSSSREKKDRFEALDKQEILQKIAQLDVFAWYYKGTQERHIGPVAEQFFELFHTGVLNDPAARHYISTIDPAGVALVGIQGLIEYVQKLEQKAQALQQRSAALIRRVRALEAENAALRQQLRQAQGESETADALYQNAIQK